jgi:hypothetical protein
MLYRMYDPARDLYRTLEVPPHASSEQLRTAIEQQRWRLTADALDSAVRLLDPAFRARYDAQRARYRLRSSLREMRRVVGGRPVHAR